MPKSCGKPLPPRKSVSPIFSAMTLFLQFQPPACWHHVLFSCLNEPRIKEKFYPIWPTQQVTGKLFKMKTKNLVIIGQILSIKYCSPSYTVSKWVYSSPVRGIGWLSYHIDRTIPNVKECCYNITDQGNQICIHIISWTIVSRLFPNSWISHMRWQRGRGVFFPPKFNKPRHFSRTKVPRNSKRVRSPLS